MTRPFPSPPRASWDLPMPNYSCSERGGSLLSVLGPPASLGPGHVHLDSCPTFCGEATLPPKPPSDYPPKAPFPPNYQDALYLSQSQFFRVTLILYNPTLTKPSSFPFLLAKYVCSSSLAGPLTVLHTPACSWPRDFLILFPILKHSPPSTAQPDPIQSAQLLGVASPQPNHRWPGGAKGVVITTYCQTYDNLS